ncbi:thyrostimulin alpha-2 subunit [Ixodes scapularis]|uniref:thyrostimulin alpha-2 subunit n=1 Tax=Ixodes scapularis TaxID=6945 RepID=UPI001A9CECC0|nr:thyrostimulin alpha-2 subunit [Ixodes scapularis]
MPHVNQFVAVFVAVLVLGQAGANFWERPGCHKVGHTRRVSIPDCVEFDMTTNACRGFCTSYSIPSPEYTLRMNPNQGVTSFGQCCNIMDTEDVKVQVRCLDGHKDLTFKSAKSCSCFHCKKN